VATTSGAKRASAAPSSPSPCRRTRRPRRRGSHAERRRARRQGLRARRVVRAVEEPAQPCSVERFEPPGPAHVRGPEGTIAVHGTPQAAAASAANARLRAWWATESGAKTGPSPEARDASTPAQPRSTGRQAVSSSDGEACAARQAASRSTSSASPCAEVRAGRPDATRRPSPPRWRHGVAQHLARDPAPPTSPRSAPVRWRSWRRAPPHARPRARPAGRPARAKASSATATSTSKKVASSRSAGGRTVSRAPPARRAAAVAVDVDALLEALRCGLTKRPTGGPSPAARSIASSAAVAEPLPFVPPRAPPRGVLRIAEGGQQRTGARRGPAACRSAADARPRPRRRRPTSPRRPSATASARSASVPVRRVVVAPPASPPARRPGGAHEAAPTSAWSRCRSTACDHGRGNAAPARSRASTGARRSARAPVRDAGLADVVQQRRAHPGRFGVGVVAQQPPGDPTGVVAVASVHRR
jgi:hypothetical protein